MTDLRAYFGRGLRPVILVAALALAGCGGGAATTPVVDDPDIPTPTDPDPGTPVTPVTPGTPQTGAQMRAGFTTLVDDLSPQGFTALAQVPRSGAATYNGYLYGNLANTSDAVTNSVIGQMAMRVGFTTGSATVSGTVTDFVAADGSALTGQLTLSDGSLNRAGNPSNDATLRARANGTLTDTASRALVVGVQLEGDFLGGAYNGVGGEVLGKVTVGGVDQNLDGGFIGAR